MIERILSFFFKSPLYKRLFKNAGILLSGDVIASGLGLISLALTARILGPEKFGILALIIAYISIIDQLINFQSWQALIKYGSNLFVDKNYEELNKLLNFGFLVDLCTAILGGITALFSISFFGSWQGWDSDIINMATLYSCIIFFNIEGTPTAILRLYDEFAKFSYQRVIKAISRLIFIIIAFYYSSSLATIIFIWMSTEILGYIILLYFAIQKMRIENMSPKFDSDYKKVFKMYPGIWNYLWTTNLHGSVRMASMQLDIIILGVVLGNSVVGLYKVAKQFAKILSRLVQPLYKTIYPELTKLWSKKSFRQFKSLVFKSGLIAGIGSTFVWLIFFIFGEFIISAFVGEEFIKSYSVLLWYMGAIVVSIYGFAFTPALLAMGHPKITFYCVVISTIVYFALFYPLITMFGIDGAGIAYLIFYLTWTGMMIFMINQIGSKENEELVFSK